MIETEANEVKEDVLLKGIELAHETNKKIVAFINTIVDAIGKPKFTFEKAAVNHDLLDDLCAYGMDQIEYALDTPDKNVREERLAKTRLDFAEKFAEKYEDYDINIEVCLYKMQKKVVKKWLLEGKRVDGRGMDEIRPLAAEVGVLPRVHGSGLFTRGQTQVLSICTLNTLSMAQKLDTIWPEDTKRYIHHYNFPSFSTGEARASRSTSRREIGHGNLAEKALYPVIPSVEEFPYAIRVVSEVLSSNGSTSQGSICGSTLALMDAGVPIRRPVAGISCGLISDQETGQWRTFTDIQGVEDFHGEMDFKVAGTTEGITAIQMDLKNDGLTMEIIADALERCRKARLEILSEIMLPCIAEPRPEVSEYAPKMISMKIDVDKIREVIGSGGKTIQKICADTGAKIDIDDDGSVFISAVDSAAALAAKKSKEDGGRHLLRARGGQALLRQGGAHSAHRCLCGIGSRQGRPGPHLQAGEPPRGESGRRPEHRRYDLGQGHGDRREGPRQPLPQGRPQGNEPEIRNHPELQKQPGVLQPHRRRRGGNPPRGSRDSRKARNGAPHPVGADYISARTAAAIPERPCRTGAPARAHIQCAPTHRIDGTQQSTECAAHGRPADARCAPLRDGPRCSICSPLRGGKAI